MGPCQLFLQSQSCTCQARHSLIKLVNASPLLGFPKRNHSRKHRRLPIAATHLRSLSQRCALFLPCHTANLSSTRKCRIIILFMRAGLLGCNSSRNTNWALLPSCSRACLPGCALALLLPRWSVIFKLRLSAGVIYSPFKQTLCIHCRFGHIFATQRGETNQKQTMFEIVSRPTTPSYFALMWGFG